jgi:hypothetical protein
VGAVLAVLLLAVAPAHAGTLSAAFTSAWHARPQQRSAPRAPAPAPKPVSTPKPAPTPKPPAPPTYQPTGLKYVAAQDEGDCMPDTNFDIVGFLKAHDATVMKYGTVSHWAAVGAGVQCVQAARAAGYPIYLSIDWPPDWSVAQIVAFVKQAMHEFGGSYFAVSLGNEQDIKGVSAQDYFRMWQAVAPIVHEMDPGATMVLAEASPWAVKWLELLMAMHPVDVGAVGFHCYATIHLKGAPPRNGLAVVPFLAAAMADYGKPLWCAEMAPNVTGAEPHMIRESAGAYNALVQKVIGESPNLQMISYYRWPMLGAMVRRLRRPTSAR